MKHDCPNCGNDTYITLWLSDWSKIVECQRCGRRYELPRDPKEAKRKG